MPYEIKNKLRGGSVIRVVDGASPNLTLSAFSANIGTENVSSLTITSAKWSVHPTLGTLVVSRDGLVVLNVAGTGYWQHDEMAIANNGAANITVTIAGGGGTAMLSLSKTASYNVETQGL